MFCRSIVFCYFLLMFNMSNFVNGMLPRVGTNSTPPEIIRRHGYPVETHTVQSDDGYLIEVHRIPYGKSGKGGNARHPVLLQHGLLSSSFAWIADEPKKSLGYRLADEGYDVWMSNARGNTFSRRHVKYNPDEPEFWNFSFNEIGNYDIPAVIDYVLNITGYRQLTYIGHSLGTAMFYVMASSRPEYNAKIQAQISLTPIAGISHTTSMFRLLVTYAKHLQEKKEFYQEGFFWERDFIIKITCGIFKNSRYFIHYSGISSPTNFSCEQIIFFGLFGTNPEQFDANLLPEIKSNIPAGTSGKNIIHCSQLISNDKFQQFDYGESRNFEIYNTSTPPVYNLSQISTPVRVYYSQNDLLSNPLDSQLFYQKLPKPMGLIEIADKEFNHVDFLWAKDINRLLNDDLIQFIKNMTDPYSGFEFIQKTVETAINVRSITPPPADVPFDDTEFMNEFGYLQSAFDFFSWFPGGFFDFL